MNIRAIGTAALLMIGATSAVAQPAPPDAPPPAAPSPAAPDATVPRPAAQANPAQLTYTQVLLPDALRRVQDRLQALGAYSGAVDGNWAPDSQSALERFQQNSGLQVTGQLNQATAVTLGLNPADLVISHPIASAMPANPPPTAPPVALSAPPPEEPSAPAAPSVPPPHAPFALSFDSVRLVQSRLHQLGFYGGYVDGVWGGGTQAAMQTFQRTRGLPVTDGLNGPTVTAMGLDPASMTPR